MKITNGKEFIKLVEGFTYDEEELRKLADSLYCKPGYNLDKQFTL